jgi:hypothetical protein
MRDIDKKRRLADHKEGPLEAIKLSVKISDSQVNKRLDEDLTRMHSHQMFNDLLRHAIHTDESNLVILTSQDGYGATAYLYDVDEEIIAGKLDLQPSGLGKKVLEPHTMFRNVYRGQGYAYSMYDMVLRNGVCLVSGGEQSSSANALWWKLTHRWDWFWIEYTDYDTTYLGQDVSPREQGLSSYRLVLLGSGWSTEKFKKEAKMKMPEMAGAVSAKTFADRHEAREMSDTLVDKLNRSSQFDYKRNDIDNAVSCSGDVRDVVSDVSRIGYRQFDIMRNGWRLSRTLRDAAFMSINGEFPIVVREPTSGFGTVITFLGKSLQKFQVLNQMEHFIAHGADVGLESLVPGTLSLCLTCELDKGVDDVCEELEKLSFVKTPNGQYLSKKFGLYIIPAGRKLKLIDSMF